MKKSEEPQQYPEKKKPGRPKKKVITTHIDAYGIVEKPANEDDVVEMVYCNPTMFKKLLQLYKHFEVSEVELSFTTTELKITTKDHLGKSTIYTTISGKYMNLYYCKFPIKICVKRDNLDRVLGTLGKNHYKITLVLREDYRSIMYIIVKDLEYNNENSYELDVVVSQPLIANNQIDDDSMYPIKFKLATKHFKTLINNVKKLSPIITLQKVGDEPIRFTYSKSQKVNWVGIYNDKEKIDLKSNLGPDDIFSVSLSIDYIRPFSNSNIGDEVYISAHQNNKMAFTTFLDKKEDGYVACIKIYTEIKDQSRT
jgi:hypothetical protein